MNDRDILNDDRVIAQLIMLKLEQAGWTFSLNEHGRMVVVIGASLNDTMPAAVCLNVLAHFMSQCEAWLRTPVQ
jgi:ribosomal protein S19E (S16A)